MQVAQRVLSAEPDAPPAEPEDGGSGAGGDAVDAPLQLPPGAHITRLLVPALQAGCLIGRRGDIIRGIRDASGASVRVLSAEELPSCATASERVVQVSGEWPASLKALVIICKQLRENPLRATAAAGAAAAAPGGAPAATPPHPPRRAGSSPAAAAAAAAAAAGAQLLAGGGFALPQGAFYTHPGWAGGMGMGMSLQPMGMSPVPMGYLQPGAASPARGGAGPPTGAPPGSASPSAAAGGGAPFSAHMGVPLSAVGCIIGKAGANVAQIRALSGARVKVHDQAPGAAERLIEITGTAEQVAQAQVLIQGFMMTSGAGGGGGRGGGGGGPGRQPQHEPQQQQQPMGAMMLTPVMMAPGPGMYGYGQPMMYGGPPMYPFPMGMPGVVPGMVQLPHAMPPWVGGDGEGGMPGSSSPAGGGAGYGMR
jgi:hypothetical protein